MKIILLLIVSSSVYSFSFNEFFNISDNPNFEKIQTVKERKEVFFKYLLPIIKKENKRIMQLRKKIQTTNNKQWLKKITKKYYAKNKEDLLSRVNYIPVSLVLAQAANESNWGRSRFAKYYNNFFGLWCFEKGCGVVPKNRNNNKKHEVAIFSSLQEAVSSYMLTLNRHNSYQKLRDIRLTFNNKTLNGSKLAEGLEKYSGIGHNYIKSLKDIIRVNKLSRFD
ncbi:BAX protein [hydrothermal vent metagenome]|uniref:BAX protein n=1 Tax=hydrothermal vent metagenome TaxID=652676 RepID=A0A1W1CED5_9ZZZZ